MSRNSLTGKSLVGLSWMASSVMAQTLAKFALLAILGRLLAPADFGVFAAASLFINAIIGILFHGIGQSYIQRGDITPGIRIALHRVSIASGVLLAAVFFIAAPWVAGVLAVPAAIEAIQILSAMFVLRGFSLLAEYDYYREMEFKEVAIIDLIALVLFYGVGSVWMAYLGHGHYALLVGALAQHAFRSFALMWRRSTVFLGFFNTPDVGYRVAIAGSSGFSGSNVAQTVAAEVDNIVVSRFMGAEALGLYSRAYDLMKYPAGLYNKIVGKVLLAAMSKVKDDPRRLKAGYLRSCEILSAAVMPLAALMAVFSREIVVILLGDQWLAMTTAFEIFCLVIFFRVGLRIPVTVLQATGRQQLQLTLYSFYAVAVAVTSIIGVRWGINGVSIGVSVSIVSFYVLISYFACSKLGVSIREYLTAHRPGLFGLALVFGVGRIVKNVGVSDWIGAPSALAPGVNVAVTLIVIVGTVGVFPRLFLGKEVLSLVGRRRKATEP